MLERYFVKPSTVDRIRASWIGSEVEQYAAWLAGERYAARCIYSRVPVLVAFGEFARQRGAMDIGDLETHLEAFVAERVSRFQRPCDDEAAWRQMAKEVRGPVEQMLKLVVPGFTGSGRSHHPLPFAAALPRFFDFLVSERGLRHASVRHLPVPLGPLRGLPRQGRGAAASRAVADVAQRLRG